MSRQRMKIWKEKESFLFCSNSEKFEEMSPPYTHLTGNGEVETTWKVFVEQAGNYRVGFSVSISGDLAAAAVSSRGKCITCNLEKSRGVFREQELNFCHRESLETIYLEAGEQEIHVYIKDESGKPLSLSAVDFSSEELREKQQREQEEAGKMRQNAWYREGEYGMMFHWTGESCPMEEECDYKEAVNRFDTEKFAAMVKRMGASYVIFTMNHAISHFPAPLPEWETYYPGMTTERDLVEDLYQSLSRQGIDLLMYLNFTAAYGESPRSGLQKENKEYRDIIELEPDKREDYTEVMVRILEGIGKRYGEKIKGYWIDSCYQLLQQFGTVDFKRLYLAGKTGYEKRMVTFNHWILPVVTPWIDCWSGETAGMIEVPEEKISQYGPAPGIYFHDLIIMEDDWGIFSKGKKIPETVYKPEELLEYIEKFQKGRSMLTINAEIYQEGFVGETTFRVLEQVAGRRREMS